MYEEQRTGGKPVTSDGGHLPAPVHERYGGAACLAYVHPSHEQRLGFLLVHLAGRISKDLNGSMMPRAGLGDTSIRTRTCQSTYTDNLLSVDPGFFALVRSWSPVATDQVDLWRERERRH